MYRVCPSTTTGQVHPRLRPRNRHTLGAQDQRVERRRRIAEPAVDRVAVTVHLVSYCEMAFISGVWLPGEEPKWGGSLRPVADLAGDQLVDERVERPHLGWGRRVYDGCVVAGRELDPWMGIGRLPPEYDQAAPPAGRAPRTEEQNRPRPGRHRHQLPEPLQWNRIGRRESLANLHRPMHHLFRHEPVGGDGVTHADRKSVV